MFYFTCNESKIYESFTFWNKLQEKWTFSRHSNSLRCTCTVHIYIIVLTLSMYVKLCVCERERERERAFQLMFLFSVVNVCCTFWCLMTGVEDKLFLVLVLFKPTMENALHLNLSGEASVLYMGAPYPCHQGIKMCNKHNREKKIISWNVLSLSLSLFLSLTHTHTHTHTSSVILLCVYSMYIEHCCSVAMFGAKLYFLYFFKYVKQFILFGWICLSFIRFTNCYNISSTFLSGTQS